VDAGVGHDRQYVRLLRSLVAGRA
jgi:hypothetical protein